MDRREVICPNCGLKYRGDLDKKYQDCPECKFEFRSADVVEQAVPAEPSGSSLLAKLKQNIESL